MLSHGPFNYNRFDVLNEKKAKPDFLDMDKDGDKKESMKKAIKEKDGKCKECGKKDCGCDDKKEDGKGKPPWLKKEDVDVIELEFEDAARWLIENDICKDEYGCEVWLEHATEDTLNMLATKLDENRFAAHAGKSTDAGANVAKPSGKGGKNKPYTMKGKDGKPLFNEGSCGGYQKGGVVKGKKIVKEDVIAHLIEHNYVNNEVSAEALFNHISDEFLERIEDDIMEIYVGKHGQTEKQYQDSRSNAGKMISGDSKGSGANYSYGAKSTGTNPAGGSQKPQGQARMNNKDREYLKVQKADMAKRKSGG